MNARESLDYKGHRTEEKLPETSILLKAVMVRKMKTFGACIHNQLLMVWAEEWESFKAASFPSERHELGKPLAAISCLVPQMVQGPWTAPELLNEVRPEKMLNILTTGHRLPMSTLHTWLYISFSCPVAFPWPQLTADVWNDAVALLWSWSWTLGSQGHGMVQRGCPRVASLLGQWWRPCLVEVLLGDTGNIK